MVPRDLHIGYMIYWFPGFGVDSGPNLQPCILAIDRIEPFLGELLSVWEFLLPEIPDQYLTHLWCIHSVVWHPKKKPSIPSKIEWDLANGPLRKLLELLDSQV